MRTGRLASVLAIALTLGASEPALAAAVASHAGRPQPAASAPSHAGLPKASAPQQLALLTRSTQTFSSPNRGSRPLETVSRSRPITGEQTALPVIAHAIDAHRAAWLKVLLPGRPNSHTGWVQASSTRPGVTRWQIVVRISTRGVTVLRGGRPVRSFRAVVGKSSTPTPLGRFFVEETVQLSRNEVGAPYALALSARSNVLQEFAGGPGQTALHGTGNVGGIPGTAVSHGCIRLDTQAISWLAARIGPGTPVSITR